MTVASSSHAQPLERYDSPALPGKRLSFRLSAADSSPAEARRRVRRQLAEWHAPLDTCENAQLVISELVTNALRHTASQSIGCELRVVGPLLRIAVTGDGTGPPLEPETAGEEDESGRGLLLVCTLAEVWGVRPRDAGLGHVVWADLTFGTSPF